jgi:hypothetical protein
MQDQIDELIDRYHQNGCVITGPMELQLEKLGFSRDGHYHSFRLLAGRKR